MSAKKTWLVLAVIAILIFLAIVIGGSLGLYAWRAAQVRVSGQFSWLSRETLLLMNNVLLLVAAATILLGTIYPLILDALGLGKISVGPPYFNTVFIPLMIPLLFLVGIGPATQWKQHGLIKLIFELRFVFVAAIITTVAFFFLLDPLAASSSTLLGLGVCVWIVLTSLRHLYERMSRRRRTGQRAWSVSRGYYGMTLAHIGLAVTAAGIAASTGFSEEHDVRMAVGDVKELGGYTFSLEDIHPRKGPNYQASVGVVRVTKGGDDVTVLMPEKRKYPVRGNVMTEAGIDSGLARDLYVSLGEPIDEQGQVWAVRLYYKPLISWIWWGGLLMALGGIAAASDRRYLATARMRVQDQRDLVPDAAVG